MHTLDLFGGDDARQRLAIERRAAKRMEQEDRRRKARYGTDPKHLARAEAPSTSREAAGAVDTTRLEARVHKAIASYADGCTASDLLRAFPGLPYSSVTARFAALERKGFISCGPDKRRGDSGRSQRVMRSVRAPL